MKNLKDFKIRIDYYEDWPDHWSRIATEFDDENLQKLSGVDWYPANRRYFLSFSVDMKFYDEIDIVEFQENEFINFTFVQVINDKVYIKKNYSFTFKELRDNDYWLTMVYISAGENIILDMAKEFDYLTNIYDKLFIHVSNKKYISKEEIYSSLLIRDNIIFESETPFEIDIKAVNINE